MLANLLVTKHKPNVSYQSPLIESNTRTMETRYPRASIIEYKSMSMLVSLSSVVDISYFPIFVMLVTLSALILHAILGYFGKFNLAIKLHILCAIVSASISIVGSIILQKSNNF